MNETILNKIDEILSLLKKRSHTKWLSTSEVCHITSLSESTIRRAFQSGKLKVSKTTGKNLFDISDVKRWLNG